MNELTVSEVFGITLQGEGKSQGLPCMFIRLGLCNLDCGWCDTPYTWDWTGKNGLAYNKQEQLQRMTIGHLLSLMPTTCDRVVITGGEPMVQQNKLSALVSALTVIGYTAEVETNGTIAVDPSFPSVQFNVSPKLSNSGVPYGKAVNIVALQSYAVRKASFKFVVENDKCVQEVSDLVALLGVSRSSVWLMPQGKTRTQIVGKLGWLFDVCSQQGYNLSARLHVLAHNDKRGI